MGNPNPDTSGLKPAKKGDVRNPKGKAKGTRNRKTIYKKWLTFPEEFKNPITGEIEKLEQADIVVLGLIAAARRGDVRAAQELFDSAFGKVPNKEEITGPEGGPIEYKRVLIRENKRREE